jgi:zinc protease
LLDKGTATLSRQQVQDRLDALKTQIAIQPGAGGVSVSLSTRREHLAEAVTLVAELLRRPVFPAEAFDEYKRQSITRIEAARKEPSAVAGNALARLGNPYPRGDVRYARTFDEQIQDLNALTLEQVRAFHARFYGARFAQFGAAGDIDLPSLQQALRAGFGDWNAGEPFTRVPQPLLPPKGETLLLTTPDKQNADLRARLPVALSDNDADYPALTLANHLLGSGGSSRLWTRIRETEGLSYSVYSQIAWNNFEPNSNWLAGAIFAPQNRAKVETALREELARALKDGFSAKELDAARNGLLSFRRLSRAQDDVLASALASNLYLGRTFEISARVDAALAAATPEQVNAALRKYLKPEAIDMVFAGDFKP